MLDRLPIKINYIFLAGVVVLAWAGYQLALRKTWEAYQLHQQLCGQLVHATELLYPPDYLERKEHNVSLLVQQYSADSVTFRNRVIGSVVALAEKEHCRITDFPSTRQNTYANKECLTQKMSIEGDFVALVRLVNDLETMPHGQQLVRSVILQISIKQGGVSSSGGTPIMSIYQVVAKSNK